MTIHQIKERVGSDEYNFLREDKRLGSSLILLALGGNISYGMDKESPGLGVRGIALNRKEEILLGADFEQVANADTDATVHSFNRMLVLLTANEPTAIELLGCKPEHYLSLSSIGKELLGNRKMFLSKACIHSFGGYIHRQLRRMENKAAWLESQAQNEEYILKSIQNARYDFQNRYYPQGDGYVDLYIDKSRVEGHESEIFLDISLKHYPLRDWTGMWGEMRSIVSSYSKLGKRDGDVIPQGGLGMHMAHLIRLYMMCIDILEKEEIITYRGSERGLLKGIQDGEYLGSSQHPTAAFYGLLREYEKRFEYAKQNTALPDVPDYRRIDEFKAYVNERVVKGDL